MTNFLASLYKRINFSKHPQYITKESIHYESVVCKLQIIIETLGATTIKLYMDVMRLCHPPDGSTSPEYKLLCFITTKKFWQREVRTSF